MLKRKFIAILLIAMLVCLLVPMALNATDENVIEISNFDELKANIGKEGATLRLTNDIYMTEKLTISNTVTIDGGVNTIYGVDDNYNVYFEIIGGTFTIKNAILYDFGGNQPTQSGIGVFKVPETASADIVFNASSLVIENYNRSAFDIRSGKINILGCLIYGENTYYFENNAQALTKGILVGGGANKVEGNITECTISSNSTYEDWASADIEIYNNADIKINVVNLGKISVDNYWFTDKGDINVTIENADMETSETALRIYSKQDTTAKANVDILSANITGNIKYVDKTENDLITIHSGIFNGDISEDVKLAENVILVEQEDGSYITRIDNSELKKLVLDLEILNADGYTTDSWKIFEETLSSSRKLLEDIEATKDQLDKQIEELNNAYEGLVKRTVVNTNSGIEVLIDEKTSEELAKREEISEIMEKYGPIAVNVGAVIETRDTVPTEEEKAIISKVVTNEVVAKYIDISLLIKDLDKNTELEKITELNNSVTFKLVLDEELKNVPEGFKREYKIIRIHDGEAEILDTVLSEDMSTIEFKTDRFSTYAISYVDTKIAQEPASDDEETTEPEDTKEEDPVEKEEEIVQTGDYIYIAIGVLALVAIINIVYFIKRRKK